MFASGGYDDHVRVWDSRNLKKPITEPLKVNDGVWRLKWHPTKENLLLGACMRSGFIIMEQVHILDIWSDNHNPGTWEALGYGVNWLIQGDSTSIATASFYDKSLRMLTWTGCSDN